jgi:hypothetical protein
VTLTDAQTAALERLKNGERIVLSLGVGAPRAWWRAADPALVPEAVDLGVLRGLVHDGLVRGTGQGRGFHVYEGVPA